MTIHTDTSLVEYVGNGITTQFPVPFRFLESDHLAVVLTQNDVSTNLVLNTNYTVSGANNEAGGTVTMLAAPSPGATLQILRNTEIVQEVDYITGDRFPAETHEQALDKLTMIDQELRDRALFKYNPDGQPNEMQTDLFMNGFGIYDAGYIDGDGLHIADTPILDYLTNIAGTAIPDMVKLFRRTYTETVGGSTDIVLPTIHVGDKTSLVVTRNGVVQDPDKFNLLGNTVLQMVFPMAVGEVVEIILFNTVLGIDGRGITSFSRVSGDGSPGTTDQYQIAYTDSTSDTFSVYNGNNGANGVGILSVTRIAGDNSPGTLDTYQITFTDLTTSTFQVYNGNDNVITAALQALADESEANALIADTAANSPNVVTITNDLNGLNTIGTVATSIAGVNTTATSITDVNTVATNIANVNTTAASITNVNATGGSIANVNIVADNLTTTNTIGTVATNIANVNLTGENITNVNLTGGSIANVNTVATNITNVNTVATNIGNVNTVATNIADVNLVADNIVVIQESPANAALAQDAVNYLSTYINEIFLNVNFPLDLGLILDPVLYNQFDLGTL